MCQYQANLILFKVNHVLGKKVSITKLTHSIKKYQTPSVPHSIWTNPIHYITCVFGIGALPIPGTCSTIAAIGLAFMLKSLSIDYQIAILIFLNAVGAWICDITNRDFGTHDHSAAGFDEFVTFPICMIHVPWQWPYILLAFVIFRALDILKPEPIGYIDRNVSGGFGVMLDDIVAALLTLAIMQIIVLVIPL